MDFGFYFCVMFRQRLDGSRFGNELWNGGWSLKFRTETRKLRVGDGWTEDRQRGTQVIKEDIELFFPL